MVLQQGHKGYLEYYPFENAFTCIDKDLELIFNIPNSAMETDSDYQSLISIFWGYPLFGITQLKSMVRLPT